MVTDVKKCYTAILIKNTVFSINSDYLEIIK